MNQIDAALAAFANFMWGPPLLILLVGGGVFFALYSRFLPYRHIGHGIALLSGKYESAEDEGELSHRQALAAALAGTMGMGNIAGVAMAITIGGPGAIFWMWVSAMIGVATKFFSCTLGVMYRGRDSEGNLQGGPMYIIREGLGPRFRPLAILFAIAGLIGVLPVFQANQLVEALREDFVPRQWYGELWQFNLTAGIAIAAVVATVISGGLKRLARVAEGIVPVMTVTYLAMTLLILFLNASEVPALIALIFSEAFAPESISGGVVGVMIIGISRGAFSNEAGIGTEVMAHGAAKTREPVREGCVAMLGPIIDTLIVCSCTALVILISGAWTGTEEVRGVSLTLTAFSSELGTFGRMLVGLQILFLSLTTMFTYWYYGAKCLGFLVGARYQHYFQYFHIAMVVLGATMSIDAAFNLLSGVYAVMAIPTMTATLLLAPRVMSSARVYFDTLHIRGVSRRNR